MIPACSVPIAELVLGQDHPVGLHAAQLGHAELRAVGHHRARPRDGHDLPGGDVGRAADDLLRAAVAHVDHAHAEAVGVGVPAGLEHAADDEALERVDAVVVDASTFVPVMVRRSSSSATGRPGSAYSLSHSTRDPHPNCSRKRRSFSKKMRRSVTPCLSIAMRSMPMPQAKPWTFSGS